MRIHKKKIQYFQNIILEWYRENGRDFIWRKTPLNDFQVIITEVLLQRTKAETVEKFYPSFIKKYETWQDITASSTETLEEDLKPIGLYRQRAKRLYSLSLEMCKLGGKIPETEDELSKIPMIGQYIANAILLLIHDKRRPLLDTNMARVLERFFGKRKLSDIRYDPYLQNLARKVVDHEMAKEINWGILDFAAITCKNRPKCDVCMLKEKCRY